MLVPCRDIKMRFTRLITCSVFIDTDCNCFMLFLQHRCSTDFIPTPKVTMIKKFVCVLYFGSILLELTISKIDEGEDKTRKLDYLCSECLRLF